MNDDNDAPTDAEILYGGTAAITSGYRPVLSDALSRYQDHTGMRDAEAEELLTEAALGFNDAKIHSAAARSLFSRMVHAAITPPDAATVSEWATESRRVMRERFGEAEAERRLDAARSFVEERPAINRLMASGIGSHPDFVLALAENAHRMRVQPLPRPTEEPTDKTSPF